MSLTSGQQELLDALRQTDRHVSGAFEDDYDGFSDIGFARITGIDGRGSFVRGIQSLSKNEDAPEVVEVSGGYKVSLQNLQLTVTKEYNGGYRVSVSNVQDFVSGAEHQRLDVRKRLNRLVLEGLRSQGFLDDSARVTGRKD